MTVGLRVWSFGWGVEAAAMVANAITGEYIGSTIVIHSFFDLWMVVSN